jgi:ribosomal protein S18 acetylase RimI-like enzyme
MDSSFQVDEAQIKDLSELHFYLFKDVGETKLSFVSHLKRKETRLIIWPDWGDNSVDSSVESSVESLIESTSDISGEKSKSFASFPTLFKGYVLIKIIPREIEISWLGVREGHRREGIGVSLIQKILNLREMEPIDKVIVYTRPQFDPALKLYSKLGFKIIKKFTGMDGDLMIKLEI